MTPFAVRFQFFSHLSFIPSLLFLASSFFAPQSIPCTSLLQSNNSVTFAELWHLLPAQRQLQLATERGGNFICQAGWWERPLEPEKMNDASLCALLHEQPLTERAFIFFRGIATKHTSGTFLSAQVKRQSSSKSLSGVERRV